MKLATLELNRYCSNFVAKRRPRNVRICGNGIEHFFDVPAGLRKIELIFHDRPATQRVRLIGGNWDGTLYWDAYDEQFEELTILYSSFEGYLSSIAKKHKHFSDIYVECFYHE